jgi:hypothetical protein
MPRLNLNSYAAAVAYYESLAPATNRQKTVPGSRQMRGVASHRRVRLNTNTGDVECFLRGKMLAAFHPDNSVTVYRGSMTQTDAQHHRRVLPSRIHSDVGYNGGPIVLTRPPGGGDPIWRDGHAYLVPQAGLRLTLNSDNTASLHPASATQSITTWAVDRKKSAAMRKEHKVDDFIAWARMTDQMNPGLLARPNNWTARWAVPDARSKPSGAVLEVMADPTQWGAFCEEYRHRAVEAARLAVIDHYYCWTSTEVPYLDGGWLGVKSWHAQNTEHARSQGRRN